MPTRVLRDGILTSERVDALSFAEEVFYRRLQSVVDDHGRFYAHPSLLRAACYPLKLSKVSDPDIGKWLAACVSAALVRVYLAKDGKRYVVVLDFGQRVQSKSKFPDPIDESPDSTVIHGDSPEKTALVGVGVVDEGVVDGPRKRGKQSKVAMPTDFGISERVKQWAASKGHDRLEERLDHFIGKAKANGYAYADWDEAFMGAIRDDWAKLPKAPPSSVPRGKPAGPSETPLERAVAYARQQFHFGAIDETERDRLIAEATARHRGNGNG